MHPLLELVHVDLQPIRLTQQDDVVSFSVLVVTPNCAFGKDVEKSRDLALHDTRIALVKGDPLSEQSGRIQMALDQIEVLFGVQCGGALDPRMNRVGRDDVKFFLRCENVMTGIVIDHFNVGICHHVVVLFSEELCHDPWNQRLDFADDDLLDVRMHHE